MFSILNHILENTGLYLLEIQHDHSVQLPAVLINEQLPGKIQRNEFSTQVIIVKVDCDLVLVLLPFQKITKYKMLFQMLYWHVKLYEIQCKTPHNLQIVYS